MSRATPTVSVVVPVLNGASTIGDTLHALRHQVGAPQAKEIIVVDNGATDRTRDIGVADFTLDKLRRFVTCEVKRRTKSGAFGPLLSQERRSRMPTMRRARRLLAAAVRLTPRRLAMVRAAIHQRARLQAQYESDLLDPGGPAAPR